MCFLYSQLVYGAAFAILLYLFSILLFFLLTIFLIAAKPQSLTFRLLLGFFFGEWYSAAKRQQKLNAIKRVANAVAVYVFCRWTPSLLSYRAVD